MIFFLSFLNPSFSQIKRHRFFSLKYLIPYIWQKVAQFSILAPRIFESAMMESCCATTAQTFFHFKPASIPPSPSFTSFLKGHIPKPFKKIKQSPLAPCSRQFSQPKHPSHRTILTRFVASAAPATADNTVADKLPADILVTETPEPNSRVSFLFSSFFLFF